MKYFSMFSGIGGFELGIQKAYERLLHHESENAELQDEHNLSSDNGNQLQRTASCIGYSEIDKYAIQIYERHFKHKNYGDATKINAEELPDFDLLVGGFPCQAFSIAGKRLGLDDTRGTLFYDIARIAKEKRPQHLLLENVKGLLSHDSGGTFKLIITTFAELGYNMEWQVLNSKNFGVPQNRERVFIIGHLGKCCGRQVFPLGGDDIKTSNLQYVGAIMSERNKQWLEDGKLLSRNFPQGQRVYATDGISATLASQAGGLGAKTGLYAIPVLTPDRLEKRQNGRRFKEDGDPSFTLTSQDKHGVYDGMRIRRLTPTECERLQAYPDGWTEGVSDTQRYKTLGNGVTVNVVQHLIQKLYE